MKTMKLSCNGKPHSCKCIDGRKSIKELIKTLPIGCKQVAGIILSKKKPELCPECYREIENSYCGWCKNRHN